MTYRVQFRITQNEAASWKSGASTRFESVEAAYELAAKRATQYKNLSYRVVDEDGRVACEVAWDPMLLRVTPLPSRYFVPMRARRPQQKGEA